MGDTFQEYELTIEQSHKLSKYFFLRCRLQLFLSSVRVCLFLASLSQSAGSRPGALGQLLDAGDPPLSPRSRTPPSPVSRHTRVLREHPLHAPVVRLQLVQRPLPTGGDLPARPAAESDGERSYRDDLQVTSDAVGPGERNHPPDQPEGRTGTVLAAARSLHEPRR